MFFTTNQPQSFSTRAMDSVKHWLGQCAATQLARFQPPPQAGHFGILMYHRVVEPIRGLATPTWNVPPSQFRKQLTGLLRQGYRAWPLRKVLDYRANRVRLPDKVFVVTFDDAYECVYTQAWPVLRELRVPATIFLATAYLDSPEPFPFDDWSAKGSPQAPAEGWRSLTREQCLEMQSSGMIELGAHTHTHADFRTRANDFRQDLQWNLKALREWFSVHHPTFAFPYGTKSTGFTNATLTQVVREAGFTCALTTATESARLQGDRFDWGRFVAYSHDTPASLIGKLSGWHSHLRSEAHRLKSMGAGCWQRMWPGLHRSVPAGTPPLS